MPKDTMESDLTFKKQEQKPTSDQNILTIEKNNEIEITIKHFTQLLLSEKEYKTKQEFDEKYQEKIDELFLQLLDFIRPKLPLFRDEKTFDHASLETFIYYIKQIANEESCKIIGKKFNDKLTGEDARILRRLIEDKNPRNIVKSRDRSIFITNFIYGLKGMVESPSPSLPGSKATTYESLPGSAISRSTSTVTPNLSRSVTLKTIKNDEQFSENNSQGFRFFCCCTKKRQVRKSVRSTLIAALESNQKEGVYSELTFITFEEKRLIRIFDYLKKDTTNTVRWIKDTVEEIHKMRNEGGELDDIVVKNLLFTISSAYVILQGDGAVLKVQQVDTKDLAKKIDQAVNQMKVPNLLFKTGPDKHQFIQQYREESGDEELVKSYKEFNVHDEELIQSVRGTTLSLGE